jgi:eukaryotic-like serine/threonine-protein kinase
MQETVTIVLTSGAGEPPEAVEIPRRVGTVRLGEPLGQGGGGVVFSGFDEALHRRVAVKLLHRRDGRLDASAAAELANGLRSTARIKHPHIVTIHAVEVVDRMPAIVMEFIDGVSMRELLLRTGALAVQPALYIMRSVVSAAEALHEANVVHRDFKPANILFDREGRAHVCDFGLACELSRGDRTAKTQQVGGSPLYMAPEMFDGHMSPQSDVYALGVIFFELLAGGPPFLADTMTQMRALHGEAEPPLARLTARQAPAEIVDLISRCLYKQRYMRFKTAGHLMRAIEQLETPLGPEEPLRRKIADAIAARPRETPTASGPASPSPSVTMFDLVARRADEKRRDKGS